MREPDPRIVLGLHRSRYERRVLTNALDAGIGALDTSFNYRSFSAHATLADIGSDLLPRFRISTKVGFFPAAHGGAEHSLAPGRLREAMEQTYRDLGRAPELVFLHNPERSLTSCTASARDMLGVACTALERATADGLCGAWGISSWDPRPLLALVDPTLPKPGVIMIRAGLLVGVDTLEAADAIAARWNLDRARRWGMSPFGGNARDFPRGRLNPQLFIRNPDDGLSGLQAAFRVAYSLPEVDTVSVGTDSSAHLKELLEALRYEVDGPTLHTYRRLLRERADRQLC